MRSMVEGERSLHGVLSLTTMEAPRATVRRARSLRRRMTPPEARLGVALRGKALEGWRFRRQHPIGPYVLDFYCDRARLAVEVDGQAHWIGSKPGSGRGARRLGGGARCADLTAVGQSGLRGSDAALRMIDNWAREGTSLRPPRGRRSPSTAFRGPPPPTEEENCGCDVFG